ncbi:MAG: ERF family protein [Chloroflexi bacterium]|nr:ERF family protein [Chloroflexota bacterium]
MNNIYQSINQVISQVGAVGKDKKNTQQNYAYRGVDDVMNALQPALAEAKLCIVPQTLEHIREERTSKSGNDLIYSILKIKYTFYAEDGSSISAIVIGEGMDFGDKASNKAMSIAFKYACFQVFCIPTAEMSDPNAQSHQVKPSQPAPPREIEISLLLKPLNGTMLSINNYITKTYPGHTLQTLTDEQYATLKSKLKTQKAKAEAKNG